MWPSQGSGSLLTLEGFLLGFKDREWVESALCKGMGADFFFPPKGVPHSHIKKLKELCASCPVQQECRDYGEYESHGVWGGVPARERQKARSQRSHHVEASPDCS